MIATLIEIQSSWILGFFLATLGSTFWIWNFIHEKTRDEIHKQKLGKSTLIVTAHPDDECMFFTPIIQALILNKYESLKQDLPENCADIFVLCLSTGDFDGLGSKRQVELMNSCVRLGIVEDNIYVLDNEHLQDGPGNMWDPDLVSSILSDFCLKHDIETIFTFDRYGVSGHPNHIAVWEGVRHFISSFGTSSKKKREINAYELESVNLLRKYVGFFDCWSVATPMLLSSDAQYVPSKRESSNIKVVANLSQFYSGYEAMHRHRTQLVWFRRLYIFLSRYMFINTFKKISSVHE